ncbi:MAG: hypothetical protein AAB459_01625 [Patescibacteria group bacterium]
MIQNLRTSIVLALIFAICASSASFAQTNKSSLPKDGLTVAPAYLELGIPSSGESKKYSIDVTNNYSTQINLAIKVRAAEEQNGKFLPALFDTPLLNKVFTFENLNLQLGSKQKQSLNFSLNDNMQLAPGGHYFSILLSQQAAGSGSINFDSSISVLIYLIKEAGAVRRLSIVQAPKGGLRLFSLPNQVSYEFKNEGNVSTIVRGSVILSASNKIYKRGIINESVIPLQPGRIQRLQSPLTTEKSTWLPAKLNLESKYRRADQADYEVTTTTIFYLPWHWIISPVLLVWLAILIRRKINKVTKRKNRPKLIKKSKNPKIIIDIVVNKDKQA